MNDVRILLRPKWLLGHVLALSLILLFTSLGFWQLRRLGERTEINERIEARLAQEPLPLTELLAGGEPREYRRVFLSGQFDASNEVLLRSRSRDGQAGWHVLTPLLTGEGEAVLVDRGWVPYELDEVPVEEAAPPDTTVEIEGFVRLSQEPAEGGLAFLAPSDPAEGRLRAAYYVDLNRFEDQMPYRLAPVFVELSRQRPAQSQLPLAPQPPSLRQGSHLSYALQWFTFAAIGVIGYAILLASTVRAGGAGEQAGSSRVTSAHAGSQDEPARQGD